MRALFFSGFFLWLVVFPIVAVVTSIRVPRNRALGWTALVWAVGSGLMIVGAAGLVAVGYLAVLVSLALGMGWIVAVDAVRGRRRATGGAEQPLSPGASGQHRAR